MPDITNADRRARAEQVVEHYCDVLGGGDDEEVITDLLADLMHRYGKTVVKASCRMAAVHYLDEVSEEAVARHLEDNP